MRNLSDMTEHCVYGEPLKHTPQSHSHKHTLFLSLSLSICERRQWCYPSVSPSNQRSLHSHQSPWQLCSDGYSHIPGNITAAAKTIPKDQKEACGVSMKCFSHCLVLLCRKTLSAAIYPWQHKVILRLNVDSCQSACILISHEKCCYKWNVCLCMQKQ